MNHYDTLEVSPKASPEVIRAAYKSLMQHHHPDKTDNAPESAARAPLIAQAYAVLSDPARRAEYDAHLGESVAPQWSAARAQTRARPVAQSWRSWYGMALVVVIVVAGAALLLKSPAPSAKRQTQASASAPAVRAPTTQASDGTPTTATRVPQESPAQLQARTVSAYLTSLSIELDSPQPGQNPRKLLLPDLALRLPPAHADAWREILQRQRGPVIQALLPRLAQAQYEQLVQPQGERYLTQLIANAITQAAGLDAGVQPGLEVLLAQSYTVR